MEAHEDAVGVANAQRVSMRVFRSIAQVPAEPWDALAPRDAVGLERPHLRAIEESRVNDVQPYYLVGEAGGTIVGIAYAFAIDLSLSDVGMAPSALDAGNSTGAAATARVLECGHVASLGMAFAARDAHRPGFVLALAKALQTIAADEGAAIVLLRDVPFARYAEVTFLEHEGFAPMLGFPIARMNLEWDTFDAYLDALRHKNRKSIVVKRERFAAPELAVEVVDDYASLAPELERLWRNVADRKRDFGHERLTTAYFDALARHLRCRSHVVAVRRSGDLIAFVLCHEGDSESFAAHFGMDYGARDEYDTYFNTALEALRAALARRKRTLNLGVSSYAFKTFMGCELEPSVYLLKLLPSPEQSGAIADLLQAGIEQPRNPYRVFKARDVSGRLQPDEALRQLRARRGERG